MARWQKRARLGVGLFGVAVAIGVYAAMGERQTAAPIDRPTRFDPRAILESAGAALQQFEASRQDFVVRADRQLAYEDGSTKSFGVTIEVRNRGGRDFVVTAREAQARNDNNQLQVDGDVKLVASDGFTITASQATFNRADATMHVPGAVAFSKGLMSGAGGRMTYNQATDVLSLDQTAHVTVTDNAGKTVNEFTSVSATLARVDRYLALDGQVRALRGEQVLEADKGLARLSEDQEHITFIELRGNARVTGGDTFDSMLGQDIDLDYTDDGITLERVGLRGGGRIAMKDDEGGPGRQFEGESLDLSLAPDASLIGAFGRGSVRVMLPRTAGEQSRSIQSDTFDAGGEPGKGLTSGRFSGGVSYQEEAAAQHPARTAKASTLEIALAGDEITQAVFTGSVRFQEDDLSASGARGEYDPQGGTLRISGADAGNVPRVVNTQIQIDADAIGITLAGPRVAARGNVRTILQPRAANASSKGGTEERLPRLLQQGSAANVNGDALDYQGEEGIVTYSGNGMLWQGETAIRADTLRIDRASGDLTATGAARSNLVFESGVSIGRADEIRYDDSARTISYQSPKSAAPVAALPPQPPASIPMPAQLSGPQGDLRARRVDAVLAPADSRMERLEA